MQRLMNIGSISPRTGDVAPTRSQLPEMSSDKGSTSSTENHQRASSSSSSSSLLLMESQETESKATRWTDEKHSLYLKSMEASFVDHLYNSLDMLGWSPNEEECSTGPIVSSQKQQNGKGTPTPSGQFKVFRDGSWARINFRKETTRVAKVEGHPSTFLANPWIKHYKSSCRSGTGSRVCSAFQERAPLATDSYLQLEHQDSVGNNAEVTDQNFVNEVSEEDKSSSRVRCKKYRKTARAANTSSDQVVPSEINLSLLTESIAGNKKSS